MSADRYVSETDQKSILQENCQKIEKYARVRKDIRAWYAEFGFDFPYSCENNFRDSWFHYRKLYQEHSIFEMTSQIAMLDEHIQRAEKDSIIYFFQKASEVIEFWRDAALHKKVTGDIESRLYSLYRDTGNTPNRWVTLLWNLYFNDAPGFAVRCRRIADRYILTDSFRVDAQQMLHAIKNQILEIRMGGAHIQRMDSIGGYLDKFKPCFEQLTHFCDRYRIKRLFVVSELIEEMARIP